MKQSMKFGTFKYSSIDYGKSLVTSEVVLVVPNGVKKTTRSLRETIFLYSTIVAATVFIRIMNEFIMVTDSISRAIGKRFYDVIHVVSLAFKNSSRSIVNTITITDTKSNKPTKSVVEPIAITGSIAKKTTRSVRDIITVSANALRMVMKSFTGAFTVNSAISRRIFKVIRQPIIITQRVHEYLNGYIVGLWTKIKDTIGSWTETPDTTGSWTQEPDKSGSWTKEDNP